MLKLRAEIDLSDPNAIDGIWRELFSSENQIVISQNFCAEASRFLNLCQKFKLVANDISDQQVIKRLNYFDISDSAKFAGWNFVSSFQSQSGKARRLSISKMFSAALSDHERVYEDQEIKELKVETYKALEFENIAQTTLLYRNRYSHWHQPINDYGHALKILGTLLRYVEIFETIRISNADIELLKKRVHYLNSIFSADLAEEKEPIFHQKDNLASVENQTSASIIRTKKGESDNSDHSDELDEFQIQQELPEVKEKLAESAEQRKQALLRLSARILDSNVGKDMDLNTFILNRIVIGELIKIKPKEKNDLLKSPTIEFYYQESKELVEDQIERFSTEILEIFT